MKVTSPRVAAPAMVATNLGVSTGQASLHYTNLIPRAAYALSTGATLAGPWETNAVFVATNANQTLQAPATNPAAIYRLELLTNGL